MKTLSLCSVLALIATPLAAQDTHDWRVQSLWSAGTVNQQSFEDFAKNVATMTDGRVAITPLPVGAVVGYTETLDAVEAGILQAQHSGGSYFAGREPAFAFTAEFGGVFQNTDQVEMWFYYGGGLELVREVYEKFNMYYVGPVCFGTESVPSKREVRTLADLDGLKMRVPEGLQSEVFSRLGVAVTALPGSEVYTALERGVIDATDWGTLSMNQDLGFHDIAPYAIYPGFHSISCNDFAVNLDAWNALDDDLKALVTTAVRDWSRDSVQRVMLNDASAGEAAEASGATLVDLPQEERLKYLELAREVREEFASRNDLAERIHTSLYDFADTLGLSQE